MKSNVIRAWKDENYSLSQQEFALLPVNPVGELELSDAELAAVYGGGDGTEQKGTINININILPSLTILSLKTECDGNQNV